MPQDAALPRSAHAVQEDAASETRGHRAARSRHGAAAAEPLLTVARVAVAQARRARRQGTRMHLLACPGRALHRSVGQAAHQVSVRLWLLRRKLGAVERQPQRVHRDVRAVVVRLVRRQRKDVHPRLVWRRTRASLLKVLPVRALELAHDGPRARRHPATAAAPRQR